MRHRIDIPTASLKEASAEGYYLRPFLNTEEDVRALVRLEEAHIAHPFWDVMPEFAQKSLVEKYDYIRQEIKERNQDWGRDFILGIFAKGRFKDRLVGEIGTQTSFFSYTGIADGQTISGRAAGLEIGICLNRRPADAALFSRQGLAVAATETLLKEINRTEKNIALYARVKEANVISLRYCEKCGLRRALSLTSVNGKPCSGLYLMQGTIENSLQTIRRNRNPVSQLYLGQGAGYAR